MNTMVCIDRPHSAFVQNVSFDIEGWIALDQSEFHNLKFKIDNIDCHPVFLDRPDVERALNPKGVKSFKAVGWSIRVSWSIICKTKGRVFRLSILNQDKPFFERYFYKSKSLRHEVDNSPLVFMHIPKTGGTALRFFVDNAFSEWPVLNVYDDYPGVSAAKLNDLSPQFLASRELVFGHFAFGFNESLTKDAKYFVMFRTPRELIKEGLNK